MNADSESDKMMFCASCGIPEVDDVKLKDCSACKLVRYCGVQCQKEHRPQHKRACKQRAAELREEILFKQPESSHMGDCPICCLPLSLDSKAILTPCCCTVICHGCDYANQIREVKEKLDHKCPFCRHPNGESDDERNRSLMKRVDAKDPAAIRQVGGYRNQEGDYKGAFEYWTEAAGLGDIEAHYDLSVMYRNGHVDVVEKDKKKQLHHLEEAAIGGDPFARHNLGVIENENGRVDRATKHFIIAAKLGYDDSLVPLKEAYREGLVRKEGLAATLRGHQAAVDATKSLQREEGEVALSQQREAAKAARKDTIE